MLPKDWKKEIDQTIGEAKSAYENAQHRAADVNREIAARINTLTNELERYNSAQEREEPRKRCRENWTIGGLIATAIFTLCLAAFSLLQIIETRRAYGPIKESADAAKSAAETADKTLKASQRPWVYMEPVPTEVTFDDEGIGRFSFNYFLHNTGKDPALEVSVDIKLLPDLIETVKDYRPEVSADGEVIGSFFPVNKELKTFCDVEKNILAFKFQSAGYLGHPLFPGQPFQDGLNIIVHKEQIQKARAAGGLIAPVLLICVSYRFGLDNNTVHQTGDSYIVVRVMPDDPLEYGINPDTPLVSARNLRLIHTSLGGGFAD